MLRRTSGRWMAGAALVLTIWLSAQVGSALAQTTTTTTTDSSSAIAQVLPTPTPFRFLTPTPFVPAGSTTTSPSTTTAGQTPPKAGGFPMELAFPILAGGLAAIGGGSLVLRRKTSR